MCRCQVDESTLRRSESGRDSGSDEPRCGRRPLSGAATVEPITRLTESHCKPWQYARQSATLSLSASLSHTLMRRQRCDCLMASTTRYLIRLRLFCFISDRMTAVARISSPAICFQSFISLTVSPSQQQLQLLDWGRHI